MRRSICVLLCAATLSSFAAIQASAAVVTTNPYLGVKVSKYILTSPRNDIVYVAEVDLTAPGIRVQNTGASGNANETNFETTRNYANRVGAQLAINTAFFSSGTTNNVNGLLWSNGTNISQNDIDGRAVLNVSQANIATVGTERNPSTDATGISGNPSIYNAVAGSQRLITNGALGSNLTGGSGAPTTIAARTASGVSQDNKTLYLMTVEAGTSASIGMTVPEVASFMLNTIGAYNALNFDGGGSASFIYDDPTVAGGAVMLNHPIDNGGTTERAVAANMAIFAIVPEPTTVLSTGAILACFVRRKW